MTTAADDTLLAALRARLGADGVLTGADAAPFLTDQRRVLHGQALAVARPAGKTTSRVAIQVLLSLSLIHI